MFSITGSIVAAAMMVQPSIIDGQSDNVGYDIAKQFASCAGLYDALSVFILDNVGESPEKQKAEGLARGALLAGEYVAAREVGWEKAKEFVGGLRETYAIEWRVQASGGLSDKFKIEMAICRELSEFQSEIIEALRKESFKPDQ